MSETAFLISERAFGGAAGAAAGAKLGSAAYEPAPGRAGKPGGPGIRGAKIKPAGLFSHPESFKSMEAFIYGANEAAHYYEKNLLRGKNTAMLKFVPAAGAGGRKAALASNNLLPGAKQMMELYGMRSKIEESFDSLKNLLQGFSHRFWSESTPKMRGLDYKGVRATLESGLDEKAKSGVFKPLRAIEAFLAFSGVALGLVQMASAEYSSNCKNYLHRYARTPNSSVFATAVYFLRKTSQPFIAFSQLACIQDNLLKKKREAARHFRRRLPGFVKTGNIRNNLNF
jgi:hypothetical protein